MLLKLFTEGEASDPGYANIRDAKDGILKSARWHCEYLWILYQHHADEQFRREIRDNFDARFWEMYLTMSLIFAGYEVTCPKPGPDIGIMYGGRRIWFEATTPTRGVLDNPDRVPEAPEGVFEDVPEDQVILRYLSRISDKSSDQYQAWLQKGIVTKEDAYVIALNTCELGFHDPNADPPRILQTAFGIGRQVLVLDRQTAKVLDRGYEHRESIARTQPVPADGLPQVRGPVPTGIFQQSDYAFVSGLLCSHVDAANRRGEMGSDFQFVNNPNATARLPADFRLKGTNYEATSSGDGLKISRVQ